jgi:hypothetical protein
MTYAKPELVLMADARIAIQTSDPSDTNPHKEIAPVEFGAMLTPTSGAYEADE